MLPEKAEAFKGKYLCPICQNLFSIQDLEVNDNRNYLTEEHVPPESVQWKRKVLTCKVCNNTQGSAVDSQQAKVLNTKAFNLGILGTVKDTRISFGDKLFVNGTMMTRNDGKYTFVIDPKRSNPKHVLQFNDAAKSGSVAGYEARWNAGDLRKNMISIIRAAYLWGFADLGYAFIFNTHFSKIREQILFPEKDIYSQRNIIQSPTGFDEEGIHIVAHPENLGISAVVMNLTASGLTDQVCVLLPGADSRAMDRLDAFKNSLKDRTFELVPLREFMSPAMLLDPDECMNPYMFWLATYEPADDTTGSK
ncbi:hypothetical protein [Chryseolinea lacunae]|uniref:HNH endonuclease 5 domain-containing protein n=1 Tax=Chryseolinea lacunae TaxID=2801331 RepID=A0ABS1KTR9_9BACT|nr:hypothetical protein [Chryseolinea lacunae]MBL0742632.1 hypothetical protein [Chryseolinea lacunae]